MTNSEVLNEIRHKAKNEQRLTLEVIELIQVIDRRKIYLTIGFGSLFEFVTKDLGYEPGSAMRRIQAARLLNEIPEVKGKIETGVLSLTVISQVQNFAKKESRAPTRERKIQLLNLVENKTSREAEKELVKLAPETVKRTESLREISENLTELKITLDNALLKELDELKLQFSHQNPNLSYVELIRILAKKARAQPSTRATPAPESRTRHIPSAVRRYVWKRDGGCCQYVDPHSGRKCCSRYMVQIDHIQRFSASGSHEAQNLRLYCAAHNGVRG